MPGVGKLESIVRLLHTYETAAPSYPASPSSSSPLSDPYSPYALAPGQYAGQTSLQPVQRNHHVVMGMEEDPEDHKAVAASIFLAVAVYGVRRTSRRSGLGLTLRRVS